MIIRPRTGEDGDALELIARQTHQMDGYPKYLPTDLRSFIYDDDALGGWVAEDDGELLGHVALHPDSGPQVTELALSATGLEAGQVAFVARLFVAPAARRLGTGRALLDQATGEAKRLGRSAVLDVVEEHRAAIALYERDGWACVGRVEWMLPGDLPLSEFVYVAPSPSR